MATDGTRHEVQGRFFDGEQSRQHDARLVITAGEAHVLSAGGDTLLGPLPLAQLEASARIGNTPRFVRLAGAARFETGDNDAIDALLPPRSRWPALAHRLESSARLAILALITTVVVAWAGVKWGIPAVSRPLAEAVPAQVLVQADNQALQLLDRVMLGPSRLPAERQATLQARFEPLLREGDISPPLTLLFRDGRSVGANAMALPGGTIIITDQLVALAKHEEELIAVLAHEIGHAAHRHIARRSIQSSGVAVVAGLWLGDVSSLSSMLAAVPAILLELGYSREFEREADEYAARMLLRHGISPSRLADILERLDSSKDEPYGYLSTHPPTPERARALRAMAGGN